MQISLKKDELQSYVKTQLEHFFPDKYRFEGHSAKKSLDMALERLEFCFSFIKNPLYRKNGQTYFNHLHGDQYSQFLYYLSNSLWKNYEDEPICDKIMQLNRLLSGCFWSYKSGLPDIFYCAHPVGAVLGKAKYGNLFVYRQNCTVATQMNQTEPFGDGLSLSAGTAIMNTEMKIGSNVVIGTGTTVYKMKQIEGNSLVIRDIPGGGVIKKEDSYFENKIFSMFDMEKYRKQVKGYF